LNLQENPAEPYFACPYCLTKVKPIEEPKKTQVKAEENSLEKEQPNVIQVKTKEKMKENDKPVGCHYHPGYLSERSSKEQIPEECVVCTKIVECMLRKMRE
jgi:uncharacterized Zn finger protein (UPF0148 family)